MSQHSHDDALWDTQLSRVPAWRTWLRRNDSAVRKWAIWLFWFAFFTQGAFGGARDYQRSTNANTPTLATLAAAATFAACTTLMVWVGLTLTKRYQVRRGQIRRHLGFHFLGAAAVPLLFVAHDFLWSSAGVRLQRSQGQYSSTFFGVMFVYSVFLVVAHAVRYVLDMQRSEEATLRLKAQLSEAARQRMEAELRALKTELSPRFLVDALETVSTLITAAPDRAERSLTQLGDLMRWALHRGSTREVPLREELDGLTPFLELEKARCLGDLHVQVEVEHAARDALVPDMILQPIVSTMLAARSARGTSRRLTIAARRVGENHKAIEIVIERSGSAMEAQSHTSGADFMDRANIHSRLKEMYGEDVCLELQNTPENGLKARLLLPRYDDESERRPDGALPVRPTAASTRRNEILKSVVALAWFLAWWPLFHRALVGSEIAVFGKGALPAWYVLFHSGLVTLVFTLTIAAAFEMQRRVPWLNPAVSKTRKLLAHTGAAAAVGIVHLAVKAALIIPRGLIIDSSARHLAGEGFKIFMAPVASYGMAALLAFIIFGVRQRIRAERDALRLKAEMNEAVRRKAESELRALQAELNPHFLGNALHTVSSLIRTAPDDAIRLLNELQHLLRLPMSRAGTLEVTLAEELAMLEPYLAIERARIGRPLDVRWKIDQDVLRARVPQMILQPLVENAVKHGLAHQGDGDLGCIEIVARRQGDQLEITVCDEGVGVDMRPTGTGRPERHVGVTNIRARLRELYGSRSSFDLSLRAGGGTVARILVPWHEEPVLPSAATHESVRIEAMMLA